jgi:hypothetical protein
LDSLNIKTSINKSSILMMTYSEDDKHYPNPGGIECLRWFSIDHWGDGMSDMDK